MHKPYESSAHDARRNNERQPARGSLRPRSLSALSSSPQLSDQHERPRIRVHSTTRTFSSLSGPQLRPSPLRTLPNRPFARNHRPISHSASALLPHLLRFTDPVPVYVPDSYVEDVCLSWHAEKAYLDAFAPTLARALSKSKTPIKTISYFSCSWNFAFMNMAALRLRKLEVLELEANLKRDTSGIYERKARLLQVTKA